MQSARASRTNSGRHRVFGTVGGNSAEAESLMPKSHAGRAEGKTRDDGCGEGGYEGGEESPPRNFTTARVHKPDTQAATRAGSVTESGVLQMYPSTSAGTTSKTTITGGAQFLSPTQLLRTRRNPYADVPAPPDVSAQQPLTSSVLSSVPPIATPAISPLPYDAEQALRLPSRREQVQQPYYSPSSHLPPPPSTPTTVHDDLDARFATTTRSHIQDGGDTSVNDDGRDGGHDAREKERFGKYHVYRPASVFGGGGGGRSSSSVASSSHYPQGNYPTDNTYDAHGNEAPLPPPQRAGILARYGLITATATGDVSLLSQQLQQQALSSHRQQDTLQTTNIDTHESPMGFVDHSRGSVSTMRDAPPRRNHADVLNGGTIKGGGLFDESTTPAVSRLETPRDLSPAATGIVLADHHYHDDVQHKAHSSSFQKRTQHAVCGAGNASQPESLLHPRTEPDKEHAQHRPGVSAFTAVELDAASHDAEQQLAADGPRLFAILQRAFKATEARTKNTHQRRVQQELSPEWQRHLLLLHGGVGGGQARSPALDASVDATLLYYVPPPCDVVLEAVFTVQHNGVVAAVTSHSHDHSRQPAETSAGMEFESEGDSTMTTFAHRRAMGASVCAVLTSVAAVPLPPPASSKDRMVGGGAADIDLVEDDDENVDTMQRYGDGGNGSASKALSRFLGRNRFGAVHDPTADLQRARKLARHCINPMNIEHQRKRDERLHLLRLSAPHRTGTGSNSHGDGSSLAALSGGPVSATGREDSHTRHEIVVFVTLVDASAASSSSSSAVPSVVAPLRSFFVVLDGTAPRNGPLQTIAEPQQEPQEQQGKTETDKETTHQRPRYVDVADEVEGHSPQSANGDRRTGNTGAVPPPPQPPTVAGELLTRAEKILKTVRKQYFLPQLPPTTATAAAAANGTSRSPPSRAVSSSTPRLSDGAALRALGDCCTLITKAAQRVDTHVYNAGAAVHAVYTATEEMRERFLEENNHLEKQRTTEEQRLASEATDINESLRFVVSELVRAEGRLAMLEAAEAQSTAVIAPVTAATGRGSPPPHLARGGGGGGGGLGRTPSGALVMNAATGAVVPTRDIEMEVDQKALEAIQDWHRERQRRAVDAATPSSPLAVGGAASRSASQFAGATSRTHSSTSALLRKAESGLAADANNSSSGGAAVDMTSELGYVLIPKADFAAEFLDKIARLEMAAGDYQAVIQAQATEMSSLQEEVHSLRSAQADQAAAFEAERYAWMQAATKTLADADGFVTEAMIREATAGYENDDAAASTPLSPEALEAQVQSLLLTYFAAPQTQQQGTQVQTFSQQQQVQQQASSSGGENLVLQRRRVSECAALISRTVSEHQARIAGRTLSDAHSSTDSSSQVDQHRQYLHSQEQQQQQQQGVHSRSTGVTPVHSNTFVSRAVSATHPQPPAVEAPPQITMTPISTQTEVLWEDVVDDCMARAALAADRQSYDRLEAVHREVETLRKGLAASERALSVARAIADTPPIALVKSNPTQSSEDSPVVAAAVVVSPQQQQQQQQPHPEKMTDSATLACGRAESVLLRLFAAAATQTELRSAEPGLLSSLPSHHTLVLTQSSLLASNQTQTSVPTRRSRRRASFPTNEMGGAATSDALGVQRGGGGGDGGYATPGATTVSAATSRASSCRQLQVASDSDRDDDINDRIDDRHSGAMRSRVPHRRADDSDGSPQSQRAFEVFTATNPPSAAPSFIQHSTSKERETAGGIAVPASVQAPTVPTISAMQRQQAEAAQSRRMYFGVQARQ